MKEDWRKVGVGLLTAEGLLLAAAGAATIIVGATLKLMQYDTDYIGLSVESSAPCATARWWPSSSMTGSPLAA